MYTKVILCRLCSLSNQGFIDNIHFRIYIYSELGKMATIAAYYIISNYSNSIIVLLTNVMHLGFVLLDL